VLSDLGMGDVSGWDVAKAVRRNGTRKPVLGLVTGWGATISEDLVKSHGVQFVIAKPFDIEDLVSKVNQAIESRPSNPAEAA